MQMEKTRDLAGRCEEINTVIRAKRNVGIVAAPGPTAVFWYKQFVNGGKDGVYKISRTQAKHYLGLYGLGHLVDQEEPGQGGRVAEDLTGKRFGSWTVVQRGDHKGREHVRPRWLCRCKCGHEQWILPGELVAGRTTGCRACTRADGMRRLTELNQAKARKWADIPGLRSRQWKNIETGARVRGIKLEVTPEQLWDLYLDQKGMCALTGQPITLARGKENYTASLDRKDPEGDYTIDNVQWVHKDLNRMKWTMDQATFIQTCKQVIEHYNAGSLA
jgi:hypothetical protein